MKLIIAVAFALVAVAVAAPAAEQVVAIPIVRSEFNQNPEGSYDFGYEAANGNGRQETGELKQALDEENKPHNVVIVRGSYFYNDEEGKPVKVNYSADETGYHAEGNIIPKLGASSR